MMRGGARPPDPPGYMLVHTAPVHAKGDPEQEFLQRNAVQQHPTQGWEIPHRLDIPGSKQTKSQHEHTIETKEQDSA